LIKAIVSKKKIKVIVWNHWCKNIFNYPWGSY
jgi:hypothetical protein